jgi:hypothetical protein
MPCAVQFVEYIDITHKGCTVSCTLQQSMIVAFSTFLASPLASKEREVKLCSQRISVMLCQLQPCDLDKQNWC